MKADSINPLAPHDSAWLEMLRQRGFSPKTRATYAAVLLSLRRFLVRQGVSVVGQVTSTHLRAWQKHLLRKGCSCATRNQFTQTVTRWFRWLVERGTLFSNPTTTMVLSKEPVRFGRCPTEVEMKALLRAAEGKGVVGLRNLALLEVAYSTGARLEELARLQVLSVDLRNRLVRIMGKGGVERVVPLTRLAVRRLTDYLGSARTRLLGQNPDCGALFVGTRKGAPLRSPGIACVVRLVARRANMAITPHAIRRAFATHLYNGGAGPAEIKDLLGHRSYRHLVHYLISKAEREKLPPRRPKGS